MIVLDTHIWIWWVYDDKRLSRNQVEAIQSNEQDVIGINAITCWEVAKLVQKGRLELHCPIQDWLNQALAYPGIRLIELTPAIAVESTQLPGDFHNDPVDQIVVATARIFNCPLITADNKILNYPFVTTIS